MRTFATLFTIVFLSFFITSSYAQLSGPKSIPGDYATIAAAITALNTQGVATGGVTFNVNAGYTETFTSVNDGFISATGAPDAHIVFIKSGTGANPVIQAPPGVSNTLDGIITIAGGDYITFDGIDLLENPVNLTVAQQMEWGYGLIKKNSTSPFDGCQYVSIMNCTITLTTADTGSAGIYSGDHVIADTASLVITLSSDAMNNCTFTGNTIQNSFNGIFLKGYYGVPAPGTLFDQNITISNNVIQHYGTNSAIYRPAYGIYSAYGNAYVVTGNTIDNASGGGAAHGHNLYGIYLYNSYINSNGTLLVRNNSVTLSRGSNALTSYGIFNGYAYSDVIISNNTMQNWSVAGGAGAVYFYYGTTRNISAAIDSNKIINNTALNTTGGISAIYCGSLTPNVNIRQDTVQNLMRSAVSGTMWVFNSGGAATGGITNISNNYIYNINNNAATNLYVLYHSGNNAEALNIYGNTLDSIRNGAGMIYGINYAYNNPTNVYSNNLSRFYNSTTLYGIYSNSMSGQMYNVYSNNITALNCTGNTASVYGIYLAPNTTGSVIKVYKNNIYNLLESGTGTTAAVYGIDVNASSSALSAYVFNNTVSDLRVPNASGSANNIYGLYLNGSSNLNSLYAFYNTILLNAVGSGAAFATAGIWASTTPSVDLRNNIVVNTSSSSNVSPTGKHAVYQRNTTTLTTYLPASNNNNFVKGAGANNYFYYDGTNSYSTLEDYKSAAAPMDNASISENPSFINSTATPYDLHINTAVPTQLESAGVPVNSPLAVTDDKDGNTRNATLTDIGAYEFTGTSVDLTGPAINYTVLVPTSSTDNRILTAVITDRSGVPTAGIGLPVLYWKINSGSYNSVQAVYNGNSTYSFSFGTGVAANDVVSYYIAAQDNAGTPNVFTCHSAGISGYSANPPAVSVPPADASSYTITPSSLSGDINVGVGQTYTTLTAAINDLNTRGVSANTTFLLTDASYASETLPIVINVTNEYTPNASRTVTIRPAAGITSTISGSSTASVFKIPGTDYITIDGSNSGGIDRSLTIQNTNTTVNSAVIWILSLGNGAGATNDVIKNCNIIGGINSTATFGIFAAGSTINTSSTGADNDNLTFENNSITKVYTAIYTAGVASPYTSDNLIIRNNSIGSSTATDYVGFKGIIASNCTGALITGNTIFNIIRATGSSDNVPTGITLSTGFTSGTVSKNNINNITYTGTAGIGARGIWVSTGNASSFIEISNNMIYAIGGDGNITFTAASPAGIYLDGTTGGVNVYYNSVYMYGDLTKNLATLSSAMLLNTATITAVDIRNNIFSNSMNNTANAGAKNYAIYSTSPAGAFSNINNNDYFVSGTQGILGFIGAADQTSLTLWQTATGQDVNSVSGDPLFTSNTDLHITNESSPATHAGVSLIGLTTDYDGETRKTIPDIGADEFSVEPPPTTFQVSVDVNTGWNMVSIPGLHPTDQSVDTWWPFKALNSSVFQFNGSYQTVTTATPGKGYWMRHSDARTYNTGDEWPVGGITIVPNAPIPGNAGWNMIGCYNYNVATSGITTSAGTVLGSVFGYSGGYNQVTTLVPGYGYWIRLSEAANIILPNTGFKGTAKAAGINDKWGKIILTDKAGRNYTLYAADSKTDLSQYDMPPAPPAGMMDVRYESQRYVENLNEAVQTIDFNGMEYPVTVRVENTSIRVQDQTGKVVNTILKAGEKVTISSNEINKLMVSGDVIPVEYSLSQNYPNPFNPSTLIQFTLPEDVNNVSLIIYDALGQKVVELINGSMQAGYHQYQWNAVSFASGMYIYQLRTEKYVSTKKMVLLK